MKQTADISTAKPMLSFSSAISGYEAGGCQTLGKVDFGNWLRPGRRGCLLCNACAKEVHQLCVYLVCVGPGDGVRAILYCQQPSGL